MNVDRTAATQKTRKYAFHGRSFLPILEQENPEGWDEMTMILLVTGLFVDNVEQWLTIRIAHEICNEKANRRPENILRDICTVG